MGQESTKQSRVDPRNIELIVFVVVVWSNRVAKQVIEVRATIATGKVLNFLRAMSYDSLYL